MAVIYVGYVLLSLFIFSNSSVNKCIFKSIKLKKWRPKWRFIKSKTQQCCNFPKMLDDFNWFFKVYLLLGLIFFFKKECWKSFRNTLIFKLYKTFIWLSGWITNHTHTRVCAHIHTQVESLNNDYRRRKSNRQADFKSWTNLLAFH